MEHIIEALVWIGITYVVTKLVINWLLDRLASKVRADIKEFTDRLDTGQLIPVTVEVDQDQYFCYNALTKDFVCQGFTLKEIAERFMARFPESS